MTMSIDWSVLRAPTLEEMEALADATSAALPSRFTRLCEGLVIRVEDFPDDETLDDMGCASEFELLGLFRGRGRSRSDWRKTFKTTGRKVGAMLRLAAWQI